MKKLFYLIILTLILGLVLTGCLLSNVGQVPTTNQSGISYLTKNGILDPNLVGLWHFDGNAFDSSGNENHGSITGATYAGSVDAMFGDALSFGEGDYVEVLGSTSMNVNSSYTFEAWINIPVENKDYCGFFRRGDLSTSDSEIEIYTQDFDRGRKLTVVHNRGGAFCYRYFTAFPLDQWVHLVVTWDGMSLKAYYNNLEQPVTPSLDPLFDPATSNPAEPNYIGVGYNTVYMNGIIDEVRIWNTATPSFNLDVEPKLDFNPVGTEHIVTATVTIGETEPAPGVLVDFNVSGVNSPPPSSVLTDSNGQAEFVAYTGSVAGEDKITVAINEEPYILVSEEVKKYWLENFVTGGGNIKDGKKVAWTFAGTVGNLEDDSVGQFQIVDHANKIAYHCNNKFSYLVFDGNEAKFIGTFTNNKNAIEDMLTIIIKDNGEPGAGVDMISVTGFTTLPTGFSDTINGGNFQVHDIED